MTEKICISKKEYEGMKETIELLSDKKEVKQLIRALVVQKGDKIIQL